MAVFSYRGIKVGLASAVIASVALVGCGGGDDDPAASRAAESTTVPAPGGSTTVAPSTSTPGATSQASSTTAPGATTTRPGSAATSSTAPRPSGTTDFSVDYPTGWGPAGPVLATAFANGATCASALIVDNAGPAGSGPGASVEQSFVQLCWKGQEGKTLAQFMTATYGASTGFQATTLAGRPAQVSRAGTSSTYFVDTSTRRYQVTTGVSASESLRATRQAQVDRVLASLTLPD